jgi:4-hydroxy-tetrahydrodipicolinate reductase
MQVFLFGKSGKMGRAIESISHENNISIVDDIKKAESIIDFSNHSIIDDVLENALNYNLPLVIGTTGYSDNDLNKIKKASKKTAIFLSYNFSIGVQLIKEFIKNYKNFLKDSYIDIIDIHHKDKKDSPSGTAISFNEEIKNNLNIKANIHSIRSSNVIGEHEILFYKDDEKIRLKHTIEDRKVFAKGAIKASFFLKNKKNGLYNMQDLIKEKI